MVDLSIVVVTWHSAADIPDVLRSLAGSLAAGAELVVVENASGDETPTLVRAAHPGARVIVNRSNRGFAAACNQGLAASTGAYVLFLNPDTIVEPDALPAALAHLVSDPGIGVLGCRTLGEDGLPQPTVDRFYCVRGLLREAWRGRRGGGEPRGWVPSQTCDVDWMYGSFLLGRRTALCALGGFDEAYEMYGEDLDLCHRLHAAGWRVVYFTGATIMHRGNRSGARRWGANRDTAVLKGTLRFFRRRYGRVYEWAFRGVAGASFVARALQFARRDGVRARSYASMAWLCARGDPAARSDPVAPVTGGVTKPVSPIVEESERA